jgi:hypothetical protein
MSTRPGQPPEGLRDAIKGMPSYSKEEVKVLAGNPGGAQDFIDSTRQHGGATMNLTTGKVAQYGDKVHLVGKEPSKLSGHPVRTEFESVGDSHPSLSAKQFASHFVRLKEHAADDKASMGSWVDNKSKKSRAKGVQIDLSTGHKYKRSAEKKMIARNEDAIFSMTNMRNTYNEAARKRHGITEPRPPKEN